MVYGACLVLLGLLDLFGSVAVRFWFVVLGIRRLIYTGMFCIITEIEIQISYLENKIFVVTFLCREASAEVNSTLGAGNLNDTPLHSF